MARARGGPQRRVLCEQRPNIRGGVEEPRIVVEERCHAEEDDEAPRDLIDGAG